MLHSQHPGTTDDLPDAAFAVPVLGLVVTRGFLPAQCRVTR
ncbi:MULTISPECIES: hypothetical protein [Actinosynnema]|nr:hypothetical protein [Actinosynnema pretiosum]